MAPFFVLALVALLLPVTVDARSVLGIDLGSTYMKVALVRSGSPLEIVTNLHSKRKTEQLILFDQKQRFFGADANGLLQRKAQFTPAAMTEMLGREMSHPNVKTLIDRHFPVQPTYNETRKGLSVNVPKAGDFTPEELVAMVLQHAVEISVAYAKEAGSNIPPPTDIVLTVPSYYTQVERKAILDAASLANLNVLTLIDETTGAALHYAHDKNFEEEQVFLFYNMGASSLQVEIVKLFQYELKSGVGKPKPVPALQVLAKTWDSTLGGLAWDNVLVEYFADEFNKAWRKASGDESKDIRTVQRPMTKLRIAANKAKHVLSANTEYPIHMDSLHDDISLHLVVTRDDFEKMTEPLLERATKPVLEALALADMTVTNLTGIELLGGGMRVPSVQTKLTEVLDPVVLGLHMNADESMALGAAFGGANVSTAFRVRPVGMTDITPFAQQITLTNLPAGDAEDGASGGWFRKSQKKEEEKKDDDEEEWNKKATLFKANSKMGIKKTIAFTHDKDVHCALDYVESELHVEGQELTLERFEIGGVSDFTKEIAEKGLEGKPKVSLQFEMSPSGITSLVKAEASMEETYTVEEEVEVDDEEADDADTSADASPDAEEEKTTEAEDKKEDEADTTDESKENKTDDTEAAKEAENKTSEEKPKKKKKVMVEKEKKRLHKRTLKVSTYYEGKIQPHWEELMADSKAKLLEMDEADKKRVMLEESKNRVESYMFTVKNKLIDLEEELSTVSTEEQREECRKLASETEEWLEDEGYTADFPTMEEKFVELSTPFEKILLRLKEKDARPAMVEKLEKILAKAEELLKKWETTMPQVTEEDREKVTEKIEAARASIKELEEAQAAKEAHEEPAYLSTDLPEKVSPVEKLMQRLSKKPKPKPQKKESNETKSENATEANSTDSSDSTEDASSTEEDAKANTEEEKPAVETEDSTAEEEATKDEGDDEL